MNQTAASPRALATCGSCGNSVPEGEFCGACGTVLGGTGSAPATRGDHFAANPAESVLHLSVISTLLPHLPHHRTGAYRVGLLLLAAGFVVLGALRLTGPGIAFAAAAVPALYLLYLYEAEVYEDQPGPVIGATVALGLLLGIPWAIVVAPVVTQAQVFGTGQPLGAGQVVLVGVVIPLAAQALMLAGAMVLYVTHRFLSESLDGFTFGAAAALGFTLSTTVVELLPQLQQGLVSSVALDTSLVQELVRGLALPLLNASTTGLVAGALWLARRPQRGKSVRSWATSPVSALLVAALAQVGLGLANLLIRDPIVVGLLYVAVVVVLLVWVRVAIHHMLLAEAVDVVVGPDLVCSHCHREVPRMAFCPHCGVASMSTPKHGAGRGRRDEAMAT